MTSYVVLVILLGSRATQIWLPIVGNLITETRDVSFSVALGIAASFTVISLLLPRTRSEKTRGFHKPLEAYFKEAAAVTAPQTVSGDPVGQDAGGITSNPIVDDEVSELNETPQARKSDIKWWIKISGKKIDGTKTGTSLIMNSAEKPNIEMYRFENGVKLRTLVIIGKEMAVKEIFE